MAAAGHTDIRPTSPPGGLTLATAGRNGPDMRYFSDNAAPVCPAVLDAIGGANRLDTGYDGDALSRSLDAAFSELFETPVSALWVSTTPMTTSTPAARRCAALLSIS